MLIIYCYNTDDLIIRANIYCSLSGMNKKQNVNNTTTLLSFLSLQSATINHGTNGIVVNLSDYISNFIIILS